MGDRSSIEWTDASWNPVTGCTKVSPGCDHCYAENMAHRFAGTKAYPNGFDVTLHAQRLDQPLRWTKPRRVFVNSMSDLFHDKIPDSYIAQVFAVMALAPQHTFQVLTKRAGRMRSLLSRNEFCTLVCEAGHLFARLQSLDDGIFDRGPWPLPNVWLGVSTEDQKWADIRIPQLLKTPAAVRFISAEPLLGGIDLSGYIGHLPEDEDGAPYPRGLDWVIVGGESGRGARPMHPRWVHSIRHQCQTNSVPFFFKQWGEWSPLAPIDGDGKFDFSNSHSIANDGTLYAPGDLTYPDGPRYGEAMRADHGRAHLTSMYRVGKKTAGNELDDVTYTEFPNTLRSV